MKLKDFLQLNIIHADFGIDIIGETAEWCENHYDIASPAFGGHTLCVNGCSPKIPEKYLDYTVVDISGWDDGLTVTIENIE